jgi:hypothetical protein
VAMEIGKKGRGFAADIDVSFSFSFLIGNKPSH